MPAARTRNVARDARDHYAKALVGLQVVMLASPAARPEEHLPTVPPQDHTSTVGADSAPQASSIDDHLIELSLAGDEDSFAQLVARQSRRVFTIARHFFRNPETVEDIAQETFTKVFFSLSSYRRGASFEQWVARIAVNNCYDELRRRRKRAESLLTELSEDDAAWLENKLAHVSFDRHLGELESERAAEVADRLLVSLSPDDRFILLLLHAEESSVREIAQLMGWSEAKVKIRAFRARHAMRKALTRLSLAEKRKSSGAHAVEHSS
jgi:RNA polymerase sigma-70 factor, ECF subfamily